VKGDSSAAAPVSVTTAVDEIKETKNEERSE
jgi:hypothetical protein